MENRFASEEGTHCPYQNGFQRFTNSHESETEVQKNSFFDLDGPKDDQKEVLDFLKTSNQALKFVSPQHQMDKNIILHAIEHFPESLEFVKYFKDDRDVVTIAVQKNGETIKFASDILKRDKVIALLAVQNKGKAIEHLPYFRNDKDIALSAVTQDGLTIIHFYHLKREKDLLLKAVKQNGLALRLMRERDWMDQSVYDTFEVSDKEIIMEAVKQNGELIDYASKELKKDKDVYMTALKQNRESIRFMSEVSNYRDVFLYYHQRWDVDTNGLIPLKNLSFKFK